MSRMTLARSAREDGNPPYPQLGATVAKLRRSPDRKAHGLAVLAAVASLQRSELKRELPSHAPHCASGTTHTSGKAILKAMRDKQRRALEAAPDQLRRARDLDELRVQYLEMMAHTTIDMASPDVDRLARAIFPNVGDGERRFVLKVLGELKS
jgi:hypothetical protein